MNDNNENLNNGVSNQPVEFLESNVPNTNAQVTNNVSGKKRKLMWWIPLIIFVIPIIINVIRANLEVTVEPSFLHYFLTLTSALCYILVVPSIVFIIVLYNRESDEEIQAKIDSANTLDDKLLISFIGENASKIMNKKFSVSAFFFSFIYMLYRKIYFPAIILSILTGILASFLGTLSSIFTLAVCIVIGFIFNKIYLKYAKKRINEVKIKNPNLDENSLIKICKVEGGTSILGPILVIVVIPAIIAFIKAFL